MPRLALPWFDDSTGPRQVLNEMKVLSACVWWNVGVAQKMFSARVCQPREAFPFFKALISLKLFFCDFLSPQGLSLKPPAEGHQKYDLKLQSQRWKTGRAIWRTGAFLARNQSYNFLILFSFPKRFSSRSLEVELRGKGSWQSCEAGMRMRK